MNNLSVLQASQIDTGEALAQAKVIQTVLQEVMKADTHYGIIPGTDKPSLYKAGSEVILSTFRIAVEPEVEQTVTADGHVSYFVRAVGRHMQSGIVVGVGVGECSTAESKYCWRKAVSNAEFEATPENRRKLKFWKSYHKEGVDMLVRTNPADVRNTCLKMAKKRAQVDLCLTATAASDAFTQDLEDLDETILRYAVADEPEDKPAPAPKPQARKPAANQEQEAASDELPDDGALCQPHQLKMLRSALARGGKTDVQAAKQFKVKSLEQLPFAKINQAMEWARA